MHSMHRMYSPHIEGCYGDNTYYRGLTARSAINARFCDRIDLPPKNWSRCNVSPGPERKGGKDGKEEAYGRADHQQAQRGGGGHIGREYGRSEVSRQIEVTQQTFYRWRTEYGGLKIDQARRLKQLETENDRLRRAVADLTLDNQILREAAEGNF